MKLWARHASHSAMRVPRGWPGGPERRGPSQPSEAQDQVRCYPKLRGHFPFLLSGWQPAPRPPPPGRFGGCGTCTLIQEVGKQAAQDGLVADDQHILLSLQLHDHWLQALDQVLVGLQDKGTEGQALCWSRTHRKARAGPPWASLTMN